MKNEISADGYVAMNCWGSKLLQNTGDSIRTDSMGSCVTLAIFNYATKHAIIAHFGDTAAVKGGTEDVEEGMAAVKEEITTRLNQSLEDWTGYVFAGTNHIVSASRIQKIKGLFTSPNLQEETSPHSGVTLKLELNSSISVTWEAPRADLLDPDKPKQTRVRTGSLGDKKKPSPWDD